MYCEFIFLSGTRLGSSVRFQQAVLWMGRDPHCELAFDPETDLQVSGRHAEVIEVGETYQIRDHSTNGTYVNGKRVKQAVIRDGDLIELGQGGPKLRFAMKASGVGSTPRAAAAPGLTALASSPGTSVPRDPGPSGAATAGPDLGRPGPAPAVAGVSSAVEARVPTGAPPGTGTTRGTLRVEVERIPSGQRQVFEQPVIRIGRDPSAEVPLDLHADLLASYNHAKIMVLEGTAVLFDSDSTNGTFVNGQRVSRQDLRGGEIIELGSGGPKLKVHISGEVAAAGPARARTVGAGSTVFGGVTAFKNLSLGDAALLAEHPMAWPMTIGRDSKNSVVLDSMHVSGRHALIEEGAGQIWLRDLGSANGIFVGGERVASAVLVSGTEFVVGPYVLKFSGTSVLVFDTRTKTWVDAHELCRTDPRTGRNFLDRVSLKIQPGEFVTILGPSGCGKSTLLKSLNGSVRADSGRVLMNNIDFYAHYEQLKHQVGYVPQDDIIHSQLSVWRTLQYAAKLRLPPGTGADKREERIRDVLSALELYDHRHKPIHRLSGGQRKRVSIAVELLTDPAIIYLDEPTSGLDPNLEEKMMLLLREMTLRGKTVAAVTHTLDNINLCDKVAFLVEGKLVFFGTPEEARGFFRAGRLPDVYKRFEEHRGDPETLQAAFEASPLYDVHVRKQLQAPSESKVTQPAPRSRRTGPGALRQFGVLTSRYLEILTRDARNTAILLLQAPLVALFIALAVKTDQPQRGPTSTMFLIMSLSALWFGCANAARELTKEASIYARERMVNLQVIPYVASKFFVLQWLALVQVATMLFIVAALRGGYTLADAPPGCARWGILACTRLILDGVPGSFFMHLLNLYLTALNGIGLGLLVSALAGNSDKAMSLVPLVLIPQVLFSGSFGVPQSDEVVKRGAGYAMTLNWSLDQAKRIAMCTPAEEEPPDRPGTGCTTCLHAYDPFKYRRLGAVSQSDDGRCKAILPLVSQMVDFPEALEVVEDGLYTPPGAHRRGEAREANPSHIGLFVLTGYTVVLFGLICVFVRRRDRRLL
jgi:ABC-type multidrug transport system ATPase subunit/predicted component of type VI protein secretion system